MFNKFVMWWKDSKDSLRAQIFIKDNAIRQLQQTVDFLSESIKRMDQEMTKPGRSEDATRKSLGFTPLNFVDVDSEGMPPDPLAGLDLEARRQYVAELSEIYTNPKFQDQWKWAINALGNNSFQVCEEQNMAHGRYAVIGIKTLLSRFESAHAEHLASREPEEKFDKGAIIGE